MDFFGHGTILLGRCLYRKKMAFVVCVRGGAGPPCVREGTDLIFFSCFVFLLRLDDFN